MSEELIAWVDVEATGLTPEQDCMLEVACLVTDVDLNLLDETGYHAVVYYPAAYAAIIREQADKHVQQMHEKTGLWDKLAAGTTLPEIDRQLVAYARQFSSTSRSMYLGGNSITLDRNFINTYLPDFAAQLHYRSIDATTVAKLAQWWQGDALKYPKQYRHVALDDIRESIAELRYLRENWLDKTGLTTDAAMITTPSDRRTTF